MKLLDYAKQKNITNAEDLALSLEKDFKIKCRVEQDQRGDSLYTFKYNQIESLKSSEIVQECRGIVLDYSLDVVFKGFNRFFNAGEMLEITDNFDWSSFEVFEKADGSLIKLYFHNGYWQIGTNGTALAEVGMNDDGWSESSKTFRQEVIKCFGYDDEEDFQRNARKSFFDNIWYVFEFIGPQNRIVTPYEEDKMILLSAFYAEDDKWNNVKKFDELAWEVLAEEFEDMRYCGINVRLAGRSIFDGSKAKDELFKSVSNLTGLQEGFVLRDKNGMRLKVKSDLYVAAHRMRGDNGLTMKRACELVLMGEQEEYLAYFPDDKENVMKVVDCFERYIDEVDLAFSKVGTVEDKKEFAMEVMDIDFKHLLFTMKRDNCNAREAFGKMLYGSQVKMLMGLVEGE